MEKTITLNINEASITFKMTVKDYEDFLNGVEPKNKIMPMKRLLKNTVTPEDKEALYAFIEQGLTVQIASALIEEFTPSVEVSVKK